MSARLKLATIWLGGCSGCHMSLLDMDSWLFDLAAQTELVYSPLADQKRFPDGVDLTLVEGAVANADHLALAREARRKSRIIVALGDCAVTGNVTAMRNRLGPPGELLQEIYGRADDPPSLVPADSSLVPPLLTRVLPLHAVVAVDHFLPGCPPSAARIRALLEALLTGAPPPEIGRFG